MKGIKKSPGSLLEVLPACLTLLAITILMVGFMDVMALLDRKTQISQLSRQVMLEMETTGYLSGEERIRFLAALGELGLTKVDLSGSTVSEVGYGNPITLSVKGMIVGGDLRLEGGLFSAILEDREYEFWEKLVSTAKN
jgi:hypothetical protein